jgi:acetyl esterase/lipase
VEASLKKEFFDSLTRFGARLDADVLSGTKDLVSQMYPDSLNDDAEKATVLYGPDQRQEADVYWSGDVFNGILLFVPGGGFVSGSRSGYSAIGNHFARRGRLVFVTDYRLAPEHGWPAGATDVAAFIAHAIKISGNFGRCAGSVDVVGHSAGATHLSAAIFDRRFNDKIVDDISRVILISGLYGFPFHGMTENVRSYLSNDENTWVDRSPVSHLDRIEFPISVVASELDPPQFLSSALLLSEAIKRRGKVDLDVRLLKAHNHISSVITAGTPVDALTSIIG